MIGLSASIPNMSPSLDLLDEHMGKKSIHCSAQSIDTCRTDQDSMFNINIHYIQNLVYRIILLALILLDFVIYQRKLSKNWMP